MVATIGLLLGVSNFQAAHAQTIVETEIWSATMTTGIHSSGLIGFFHTLNIGSLSNRNFSYDSVDYSIIVTRLTSGGSLQFSISGMFTQTALSDLILDVDGQRFALSDTTETQHKHWSNTGMNWGVGATIGLSLLTEEIVTTPIGNRPAYGKPIISGTLEIGQTLSVSTANIMDANGKTKAEAGDTGYAYAYQWVRGSLDISSATASTYTLVDADDDHAIRVRVTFTDDADHLETLVSDPVPIGDAYVVNYCNL